MRIIFAGKDCIKMKSFEKDFTLTMAQTLAVDPTEIKTEFECNSDGVIVNYIVQGDHSNAIQNENFYKMYYHYMESINILLYNIVHTSKN